MTSLRRSLCRPLLALAALALLVPFGHAAENWIATWASAQQQYEAKDLPASGFRDVTLRQLVHVSRGGLRLRITISNEYGRAPLEIGGASIAHPAELGAVEPRAARALTFGGATSASIAAGAQLTSDTVEYELPPLANLAVTLQVRSAPAEITGHPGSRTTSFVTPGGALDAAELTKPERIDHWYFLSRIDVVAPDHTPVLVTLGDSITDGRGSTTNENNRWPDQLARRLRANAATAQVALVNQGIGGNRVLHDGLGPAAAKRFVRDVLEIPGVRWVVVFEGINDLGFTPQAAAKGAPPPSADALIAAYAKMIELAHARGVKVIGATILPFEGAFYFSAVGEAERQKLNAWIRTGGKFDGVIDFDATLRDPDKPTRLSAAAESTDSLHPGVGGYRRMAEAVDLRLFAP